MQFENYNKNCLIKKLNYVGSSKKFGMNANTIFVSKDEKKIVSGYCKGEVRIFNLETDKCEHSLNKSIFGKSNVSIAKLTDDNRYLYVLTSNQILKIIDLNQNPNNYILNFNLNHIDSIKETVINDLLLLPNNDMEIIVCCVDSIIRFDKDLKVICKYECPEIKDIYDMYSFQISQNSKYLISLSSKLMTIFRYEDGVRLLNYIHNDDNIISMNIAYPNEEYIVTGQYNGEIIFWNLNLDLIEWEYLSNRRYVNKLTIKPYLKFIAHENSLGESCPVTTVNFISDAFCKYNENCYTNDILLTGSTVGNRTEIKLWKIKINDNKVNGFGIPKIIPTCLKKIEHDSINTNLIRFSRDCKIIFTSSKNDPHLRLWSVNPDRYNFDESVKKTDNFEPKSKLESINKVLDNKDTKEIIYSYLF